MSLLFRAIVLAPRGCDFYVARMKFAAVSRTIFASILPVLLCLPVRAQGLQVDVEEFKRLQGEVADLRDANNAYQKRISELSRRIDKLQEDMRETHERSTMKMGDFATREELKKIIDRLAEVDQKRENDRKVILDEFEKLGKTLAASSLSESRNGSKRNGGSSRERDREQPKESKPEVYEGKVIEYPVEKNQTFSEILQKYNEHLKEQGLPTIRQSDVLKANPNLNPNRIYEGQKINLPVPEKK